MSSNLTHLLKTRRFAPMFITQFLGAFNDNLFKNALTILILFRLADQIALDGGVVVTLAAGIFILPFFLFSALAGQLADKYEKSQQVRMIKLAEIVIMVVASLAFILSSAWMLIAVLFAMGVQSAFFGPLKYAILPDHLKEEELIGGNAFFEAGTFLAILMGTIGGGLIILTDNGIAIICTAILGVAIAGYIASRQVSVAPAGMPDLKINYNIFSETRSMVAESFKERDMGLIILGISWFWLVGGVVLSQFPPLVKDVVGGNEHVVTLFLTIFSVGIGVGSLLCNRLLQGEVSAKYVPVGAIGITLFIIDLYFSVRGFGEPKAQLLGINAFLSDFAGWRIIFDLLGISISSGLFIVPLYAMMQSRSDEMARARTIASNNIMNALFMVAGTLVAAIMLIVGFTVPGVLLALGLFNIIVTIYIVRLLPRHTIRAVLSVILSFLYRVEVKGSENIAKAGKRAVIAVNHVSFLDGLLIGVFLPVQPVFAIDSFIARQWWLKPFMNLINAFPLDPTNPMAIKSLIREIEKDQHVVIFPEGRITVTGALMKVFEGPGMIADKANAPVVPVRIDGAQYSFFSRLRGKVRIRPFPKITITILEPKRISAPDELKGRARRNEISLQLYDLMSEMIFKTCDKQKTLFSALIDARMVHGAKQVVAEDIDRKPLNYKRLVLGSFVLGREIGKITGKGEYVGLMLPNSVGAVVTFFALQATGRVPAMLNFATGANSILSAIETGGIKTVLTSRRFIEKAKMQAVADQLAGKIRLVYLEDIKDNIAGISKVYGIFANMFPGFFHRMYGSKNDQPAVILFTSGSEGTPKGVVLSHQNLLANCCQLAARIDFSPQDIVFNALPIFHSFGLTGGMLLPMLSGIKTFLYPSPLHYRIVPALIYDSNATIMFGTDTFLSGYARVAHSYDFYSIRYVFAGAEKVRDETRKAWFDKFGLRILEAYGATETAPGIAANTPMHYKAGTVGRLLPSIAARLEPVPGIDRGGRLIVTGPNIMMGYLRAENPGVIEPTKDSQYDTGDIVDIDAEGFVTILGRAKRFAKIAGEMVSLTAVENYAGSCWPDNAHAVVAVPDERKGEQLVLVTDNQKAERKHLLEWARTNGVAELMIPRDIMIVDQLPVLGTGKTDYVSIAKMVAGK